MLPTLLAPLLLTTAPTPLAPTQEPPIPFGDPPHLAWTEPWSEGTEHDPSIPTFDTFLGAPAGTRLAQGNQIRAAFEAWAELSPRMQLFEHGVTHEGRPLYHAVVASEANVERLDQLLADQQTFADPRREGAADLIESRPAFAWMGYSIHGDETSGADAAPVLAWHLIAGTSDDVTAILDEVVVVIDPNMNPDGRARTLAQVEQMSGYVVDIDHASMQRGRWPYGRGNHYLFDMNRDWIAGIAPETRGRWKAVRRYWPQVFVDGHEMGPLETFLTYPQAEARHPQLPDTLLDWQGRFADDLGRAFDSFGWGYYTREWADGWGPFYSDAWGSLTGAVGILYEQARGSGKPVRRASGEIVPYREAVHGQFVASVANLRTLAENRVAIRRDYFEARRAAIGAGAEEDVFVIRPSGDGDARVARLLAILDAQGIEYGRNSGTLTDAVDQLGNEAESLELEDVVTVSLAQPQGRLASAFLAFDPRLPKQYVDRERADLERDGDGNIYDTTAWDLGRALDLECWWGRFSAPDGSNRGESNDRGGVALAAPSIGWAIHGDRDQAVSVAARLMELGVRVKVSDRGFVATMREGRREVKLSRGSLFIARHENDGVTDLDGRVRSVRDELEVDLIELRTQRAPDLQQPDLGGGHFTLLERPRVAILSNSPVQPDAFGHLWRHLDVELGVPHTMLDAQAFGSYDLRRYNVLILPPGDLSGFLGDHSEALDRWVAGGGTLIACGSAAASVATEELGLSAVRRHRDVLAEVPIYREQAQLAFGTERWNGSEKDLYEDWIDAEGGQLALASELENVEGLERQDEWARRFAPSGVILRGLVDERHWLTFGCRAELPVFYEGSQVLRTMGAAPIRFSARGIVRLSGLLWPEARDRLAWGAWCTVERHGAGQVILFASNPVFRGYWLGTARVFANAVVYGPGLGASAPIPR